MDKWFFAPINVSTDEMLPGNVVRVAVSDRNNFDFSDSRIGEIERCEDDFVIILIDFAEEPEKALKWNGMDPDSSRLLRGDIVQGSIARFAISKNYVWATASREDYARLGSGADNRSQSILSRLN